MVKDKKDIRPILVKFGVALAVSFAGFLYSRLKPMKTKSSQTSHSPCFSDCGGKVVGGGRTWHSDDPHLMKKTPSSSSITSISADRHEDTFMLKVAVDNSTVVLSPGSKHSGDKDGYLLPEFNDLVKEFDITSPTAGISPKKDLVAHRSDVETSKAFRSLEKDDYEQEIRHLKNMVRMLRERERNLEVQLLEFYGLKEQETAVMELQNRLKISNMEAKFFTLKIESLKVDNERLRAQLDDHAKIVAELDAARAKIKLLKKKLRHEAEQNKEQILTIQKRVSRLQEQGHKAAASDSDIWLKLQGLKDLEAEAEELRKSNLRLQLENSELAHKLDSTQILANSVLEDAETEELRELNNRLSQENEDLAKEIEQLQADRCGDAEELVYLRWINACLRYELRNFQPPHGKTVARDLSKSLSPKSEEKAKQLILEYANTEGMGDKGINFMDFESDQWSSSQASNIDSGEFDDSSVSPKTNNLNKIKIFNKLRRLLWGKDNRHDNQGLPADKTLGAEDSDSPCGCSSISTVLDAASDLRSNRVGTPSLNSSRYSSRHSSSNSVDVQRMSSLRIHDIKDTEGCLRKSDMGSSYLYRRVSSCGESGDLSLENRPDQDLYSITKSELVKFAEVLKDSGTRSENASRTRKFHRKTLSLGSFEAF